MPRPKGSKNRPKETDVPAPMKIEPTKVVPDLPDIVIDEKPIPPKPKKCTHAKESHFGGPFAELGGWCHEHGCDCMRYSQCRQ